MNKKYTLYSFPSDGGSPKEFNSWFCLCLYAFLFRSGYVNEGRNNKTNKYRAYGLSLFSPP